MKNTSKATIMIAGSVRVITCSNVKNCKLPIYDVKGQWSCLACKKA